MISLQLIKEYVGSEKVLSLVLVLVVLSLQKYYFCQMSGRPLSWMIQGSNQGREKRFTLLHNSTDQLWGIPSLQFNG
jgi:hypothetical protein